MTSDPRQSSSPGQREARDDQRDIARPAEPPAVEPGEPVQGQHAAPASGKEVALRAQNAPARRGRHAAPSQHDEQPSPQPGAGSAGGGDQQDSAEPGYKLVGYGPDERGQGAHSRGAHSRPDAGLGGYGQAGYGAPGTAAYQDTAAYPGQYQPGQPAPAAFGQPPQPPQGGYGQASPAPAGFGARDAQGHQAYGQQPAAPPPYEQPNYGQQAYAPQWGQPPQAAGQPPQAPQSWGQPPQPPQPYAQPSYPQPQYGQQQAYAPPGTTAQPGYGQQPPGQPAYGQQAPVPPAYEQASVPPAYGQQAPVPPAPGVTGYGTDGYGAQGQPGYQPSAGYAQQAFPPPAYPQPGTGQQNQPEQPGWGQPQGYQPRDYPPPGFPPPDGTAQQPGTAAQQQMAPPPGTLTQPGSAQSAWGQPQEPGPPGWGGQGYGQPAPGGGDGTRRPRGQKGQKGPRNNRRTLIYSAVAGAVAVAVAIALVAVVINKHGPGKPEAGMIPTGSSPEQDGRQVASAFLTAWRNGDLAEAAKLTSSPAAAQAAMAAYAKGLGLKQVTFGQNGITAAPGNSADAPREKVTFAVSASVSASSTAASLIGKWAYHSSLVAYEKPATSIWFVAWQPDVLAPHLTAATHLKAVQVAPMVNSVTDASGGSMSSYGDAGLTNIGNLLMKAAPPGLGKPGLDVEIANAKDTAVKGSQAVILDPKDIESLSTTISPSAEAAARAAVAMHNQSSMVVIQPSTGKILAIANNSGGNDFALTAKVAPGSSMKVITAAALFNAGVLTPSSPVACPKSYTVGGTTFHNDKGETEPAGTPFSTDFAQSCNNAFTSQYMHLSGKLASTARDYFGLNQDWNIGITGLSAAYFNAPASADGPELAQEAFGQGALTASPLAMASVAATVDNGTFEQPILVAGTKQVTATSLPAGTQAGLKQMMREVVTSGTGAGLGFGPNVYAKTGTADADHQGKPNSWMIAFDAAQNVAVACLVLDAGYGASYAGPEVAALLSHY